MSDLANTIGNGFAAYYEQLPAKVRELAEPLSEEQFWTKPFGYGNSFGHLVLHLTGNLSYYIGTEIAQTGYIRDRDREFTDPKPPGKGEALKKLEEAISMVARTARSQSTAQWPEPYLALKEEDAGNRFNIMLRCAAHAYHHVGQMIYISKEWQLRRDHRGPR
jgi:DinB family protein